mmetsp:Transcript_76454/g.155143  ORF Transcript_76454/g.155143 Transcript_76454/m.155143 type:complete len:451 (+) Transcript_76454:116-1468(+)
MPAASRRPSADTTQGVQATRLRLELASKQQRCTVQTDAGRDELDSDPIMRHHTLAPTSGGGGRSHQERRLVLLVDDAHAALLVHGLGDPHGLEGGQGRQDGAANPHGVLALRGSHNLHLGLHGIRNQGLHVLGQALGQAGVHGGAARQHDVLVHILAHINVALVDGGLHQLGDALLLDADQRRVVQALRRVPARLADGDNLAVGHLEVLSDIGVALLGLRVKSDVAQLLLDVAHDLLSSGGVQVSDTALGQQLHQALGHVTAGDVDTLDGVGQSVALVDGHGVGHTITRVQHQTGGAARGVQGQHSLDGDVGGLNGEGLEHDLAHHLAVLLGVQGGLGQQNLVLVGGDAQLVVECVVPDLLHVVPVGHDAVGDGVLQLEHTALGLGLVTDVRLLGVHANHGALLLGHAHDGREHRAGGVITSVAGLHHTAAIVDNQRGATLLRRLRTRHV